MSDLNKRIGSWDGSGASGMKPMTRSPLPPRSQYRKAYRLVRMHTDREIMEHNTLFSKEVAQKADFSWHTRNRGGEYRWFDLVRGMMFNLGVKKQVEAGHDA